jgi:hypothetical protein
VVTGVAGRKVQWSMSFNGRGVNAPSSWQTPQFILRPLLATDAELDYEAVMESRGYLRKWEQSTWPEDDFTVEANREDLIKAERRHTEGESFTYTVMNPAQTECLGCVYIFTPDAKWFADGQVTALGAEQWSDCDAMIFFWVRASKLADGMDRSLLHSLLDWFGEEWNVDCPVVVTNEQFEQQVRMFEAAGLQRRFEIELPNDPGTYLAYVPIP